MHFRNSNAILASAVITLLSATIPQSSATVLLEDDFDGYADQAAFEASWAVVGTTPTGTLSSLQAESAPLSISFGLTAQRNQKFFSESGNPTSGDGGNIIRFSLDFYDSNAGVNPYRQHHNLQDGTGPSGGAQLIALGLNNNRLSTADGGNFYMARILGYTPDFAGATSGAFFKLNDDPSLLRSTGWHNLAVEISDIDFKFFVDGSLAKTVPNSFTLRSYDVLRIGSGLSSTAESFVDNVKIETVPEPASALLLLGGVALTSARRSRRS